MIRNTYDFDVGEKINCIIEFEFEFQLFKPNVISKYKFNALYLHIIIVITNACLIVRRMKRE